MQQNLNTNDKIHQRSRKAYIVYQLDEEVQIEMICNPNTELEHRSIAKCVYQCEYNPSLYVFSVEFPNFNFLREKNTVVFEITYCPKPLIFVSFYTDRFTFNITDDLTFFYMIGLKFRRNERNMIFKDPPGLAVDNSIEEFTYFFNYILNNYLYFHKKLFLSGSSSEIEKLLTNSLNQISDLIGVFKKVSNNSFEGNPRIIMDYFKLLDEFIISAAKSTELKEVSIFLVCMYGIFPYDFFTTREFCSKSASLLLDLACQIKQEHLIHIPLYLKESLATGFYVLVNMAVKEGIANYLTLIKNNLIGLIFENVDEFYTRLNDFIRRSGTSMKTKEFFSDAKTLILKHFYETNPQFKSDSKLINAVIKNIGIISMNKENLLEMVTQFYDDSLLDVEKLKILKEEIKKKKWESDQEDNLKNCITKLRLLIKNSINTPLRDEFINLLYEMSYSVKYLFTLLQEFNYDNNLIDIFLFKKSFNSIHEITLEDFAIVSSDVMLIPNAIKNELIDSSFYDRLKQAVKKIPMPLDPKNRHLLRIVLLNEELFPNGSLDLLRDFIRNKPNFEDVLYISRDLIYPQKNFNSKKKFEDIWLNVKNHIVNSYIEIAELIRNFSILITNLDASTNEGVEFKNWLCDEIWKTISQKYTTEVFFSVSQMFTNNIPSDLENVTHFTFNEIVVNSYIRHIQNIISQIQIPLDNLQTYDKINQFISALSQDGVLLSNNPSTETIVTSLLDFLFKHSDPSKLSSNFLYENPSRESFWYRLIKSHGKFTNFLSHNYFIRVLKIIENIFYDVKDGKATINDFIRISKQNVNQRDALLAYFSKISENLVGSFSYDFEEIINTLNNQLNNLNENLKIVSDLETFFNNYGHVTENSEEYAMYIKDTKQNFKSTQFKEFNIRSDLLQIRNKVEVINKWSETVMFRNIFEMEFNTHNKNNTQIVDNIIVKFPLEKILIICTNSQEQIRNTLTSILLKEDFSQLTLSVTKKYFKGLDNYQKESNIIDEMIKLEQNQKQTLISILKTFCEINNFIKFCHSLIKLDSIYNFNKNNVKVYQEFLDLITDKEKDNISSSDSTFDKIFNSSKRLSEIRLKYLEKRDIENIIFELAEDKDLVLFLLHTPEEDIRNMVDAVDEHGDSFIRVQTIRDLLIIGSFIKSLNLKDFIPNERSTNPSEEDLIKRIHDAFKKSSFTSIDVLMNSCMKQFLGIKHLHGELSNREEASKIKAREISKLSTFDYQFNETKRLYEVQIKYGKTNKKINYRDLGDLRDRVLLLLYNEKDKEEVEDNYMLREILIAFIKIVELTERILFILNDIYHNGYPATLSQMITMEEGNYAKFEHYLNEITLLNTKWNDDLKEAYVRYYPLTYYNGNQFWELETLFDAIMKEKSDLDRLNGYYLLKYADPLININEIIKTLTAGNNNNNSVIESSLASKCPKERILKLGELISSTINPSRNGSKHIHDLKKVYLNLKASHLIYSAPTNLRIYTYLLSIHFSLEDSLPSANQLFYCRKDTTYHELISFLYRFIHCPVKRVFTLIRVENLTFELQNYLVEQMNKLCKNKSLNSYLSIICCDLNSFLHTQFSENYSIYLVRDFDVLDEMLISNTLETLELNAFVVRSDDTGAGKTHYIRSKVNEEKMTYVDFPIVDSIDISRINERLYKLNSIEGKVKFLHLTICGIIDDFEMLDYITFCLVIIGCVKHDVYVSFRRSEDHVYIEIANTYNDYLYNAISILPLLPCQEMIIAQDNINNLIITKDIKDPLQIIVNYLYNFDKGYLNDTDIVPEVGMNTKVFSKEDCLAYIQKYFIKGSHDITFRQIQIFTSVLSDQLVKFSNNYFFSCENLGYISDDNLRDIRQRIMQCLLLMVEEFTTRSIKAARDSQNQAVFKLRRSYSREEINDEEKRIEEYNSLGNILSWSSSNHMIIMFHEDGMCVTPVYREAAKVNEAVRELAESQRQTLEDYQVFSHFELLEKLVNIVGRQFELETLAKKQDYILTADNFLKMLLIIIRARCNVPIVIMGETGCGKTSLVRFLAAEIMQEGFEVINFHAGIKEHHIIERMTEIITRADILKVTDNKIWVFLDEINTCDCMGLITEIICQKTLQGERIPDNIVFIAACNPYKIRKGGHAEVGLVKQRVATRLVYRVHPLPDALIDYVWDYGSLTENEEKLYIGNILSGISGEIKKISIDCVCRSQIFIRKCEDKYSVSLRDVARFKILHEWFYKTLMEKNDSKKSHNEIDITITNGYANQQIKFTGSLMVSRKALILSVILCYYNRISKNSDRIEYKQMISKLVGIKEEDLEEMINEEQRDLVTRMELPPAIAINKALLENVFTLMVCVINKIPLFICGKPGCSKSLSIQLLVSNLRGQDSQDSFFKTLPRILAIPYQGSESSTSEGIEKIFEKAHNVLNNNQDNSILPLIVFDEIGLAEISKNNPLKILHSLLEPEKAEIAFVGISNWRLDASKMNRAVYLARPDPDLEDLENTALSIFDYYIKDPRFDEKDVMKALAKTYFEFKEEQSKFGYPDFHGTRDFYSLIKQVTREFNSNYNSYNEVKHRIVIEALCRNFGGLPDSIGNIVSSFARNAKLNSDIINRDFNNVMDLVKDNLSDRDSRFLLLFTNGESASYILDNYLKSDLKERVFMIGSEFEMDKDRDEHSFRLLSDIILYMESGNSIIMKNLDQIYGSLYDLFNQNFMIVAQKKNCRIALGSTNNPMCFVNNHFHCVVLVDIKDLNRMDPPFLNRFEKQILTFDSVLTQRQKVILKELNKWVKSITTINNSTEISSITTNELIITYNEEFSPSLVLNNFDNNYSNEEIIEKCKKEILSVSSISLIVYSILSQMYQSSRDEVVKAHRVYFEEQYHDSLNQYLEREAFQRGKLIVYTYSNILDEINLPAVSKTVNNSNMSMTRLNSGIIEESNDINLSNQFTSNIYVLNIAEIKSEKEFDQRFKTFLQNGAFEWMLIKFDAVKEKNHIPMIKFKIDKMLSENKKLRPDCRKNIVIIIYLSRKGKGTSSTTSTGFNNINPMTLNDPFSQSPANKDKLESHFLSDWDQVMIDCLNGGEIDNLKQILDLSTLEIVKRNLDQKSIAEMVFNIYLKFSFNTYNPNDMSLVKLYMTESIHKIESDNDIFDVIFKKCLEYLEDKDLGDWKIKICCDQRILTKSLNTFSAIKRVIEQIIEEPLLRIIHYLESESALNSYFYTQNVEKTKIFKQIWKEQFDKKDLNQVYTYNVTQSLNINCVFNLMFPFSKGDIYEISLALREHVEKIYMYDNAAFNSQEEDQELKVSFNNEIEVIQKIVKNSSVLFKLLSNYNERALETAYISDIVTYFLLVEMKKEYKWKNCLDIIVRKCIGFDVENLEFIYIFLWKNRKILDAIFNIFNALCSTQGTSSHPLVESSFLENILADDKLYDKRLKFHSELSTRKEAEINTFLNIFNTCAQILLSQLTNIKATISSYGIIINIFISSLMNFSLEIKNAPDALNILIVVNEFLKILASLFKNDKEEISKRVQGIYKREDAESEGEIVIVKKENEEVVNTKMEVEVNVDTKLVKSTENTNTFTSNKVIFTKYDHISLKDFKVLKTILDVIDKELEDLKVRQLNPDNFIKISFIKTMQKNVISGKLKMFENVIIGNCDFDTRAMIIKNILKDDELCRHSSMIFYHLFTSPIDTSSTSIHNTQDESLSQIISSPFKPILEVYLESHNISLNSVTASFFSDFFRKFLHAPSKCNTIKYLKDNLPNYLNYLTLASEVDPDTHYYHSKYEQIVGFAGLKHYLDIYGRYLADESLEKDQQILHKVNKSLESQEVFIEVLRNYTLKSMAAFFGGTANTLVNIDYEKLEIHWVNNKLFENNDNALGIEPNLPDFEKTNKEFNLFFVSLLNEESEENILKLKNMILNAASKPDIKFVLIQFFINKIWLSYTHPKYISSFTHQFVIKLFDRIKEDIKTSLGLTSHNLIENLVNNFPNNKNFSISPTTDTNRIGMFTLAMQMLNMLLSLGKDLCIGKLFYNEKGELYNNLSHWRTLFLPAGFVEYQDENILVMQKHIDENYEIYGNQIGLYECECGFLYTIGDCTRPYYVSQCPNCTGKIGGQSHVLMQGHKNLINADNRNEPNRKKWVIEYLGTKLKNNPGYVSKMADELSMHYSIRGVSSVGFRFLNFFNHSMIYLLTELGAIEEKALQSVIFIKGIQVNPKDYLLKHITTDIHKLSELIKSKEFYIFMHVVFNEFLQLSRDPFRFDSAIEREKFEIAFQTKIIQPKLDKLAGEISEYKMFFNNDKKLNYLSIINENFSEDEIRSLSNYELFRIFRFSRLGYWDDLKTEFMKKKVSYQFLKLLIEKFEELTNLSECLFPLIQFTNYMLAQCNYRFTRAEAKERKIREVVEGNSTAESLFIDFAKAWKKIAYKATQWQCKSLPVLDKIDFDLPVSFVLVDDRELGYGMYMAAAYQYLGSIQNEVLEAIVYLIKENNDYQIWGNMDTHKYSVQKVSPHEIIMYRTNKDYINELTDIFSKFYDIFNPNYGQGAIVEYNFEKIEDELAFKLLTNKKFLDCENLNKIQYKFELLSIQGRHSNLISDIKSKIDQVNLNEEEYKDCVKQLEKIESQNVANLHQIFSSLEIVLCTLRYQNNVENTTLCTYIQKVPNNDKISPFIKESSPISLVKLSSILNFYQLVEEKLFKYIVEFISPEYNKPLDDLVKTKVAEFIMLAENTNNQNKDMKFPTAKLLLNVIQRFIIRCLVATLEPKFPVKEYLMRVDFWDIDTKEEVIDNFYFEFPDEVLIANTLSLHQFIQDYLNSGSEKEKVDLSEDHFRFEVVREQFFKKQNKFI